MLFFFAYFRVFRSFRRSNSTAPSISAISDGPHRSPWMLASAYRGSVCFLRNDFAFHSHGRLVVGFLSHPHLDQFCNSFCFLISIRLSPACLRFFSGFETIRFVSSANHLTTDLAPFLALFVQQRALSFAHQTMWRCPLATVTVAPLCMRRATFSVGRSRVQTGVHFGSRHHSAVDFA